MLQKDPNLLYYTIERFSFVIRQSVLTFAKLVQHLASKLRVFLHEVGVQNMALSHTFKEMRDIVSIFNEAIAKKVEMQVQSDYERLLYVTSHG